MLLSIRINFKEAYERYEKNAEKISDDIFIIRDTKGRMGEEKIKIMDDFIKKNTSKFNNEKLKFSHKLKKD